MQWKMPRRRPQSPVNKRFRFQSQQPWHRFNLFLLTNASCALFTLLRCIFTDKKFAFLSKDEVENLKQEEERKLLSNSVTVVEEFIVDDDEDEEEDGSEEDDSEDDDDKSQNSYILRR